MLMCRPRLPYDMVVWLLRRSYRLRPCDIGYRHLHKAIVCKAFPRRWFSQVLKPSNRQPAIFYRLCWTSFDILLHPTRVSESRIPPDKLLSCQTKHIWCRKRPALTPTKNSGASKRMKSPSASVAAPRAATADCHFWTTIAYTVRPQVHNISLTMMSYMAACAPSPDLESRMFPSPGLESNHLMQISDAVRRSCGSFRSRPSTPCPLHP